MPTPGVAEDFPLEPEKLEILKSGAVKLPKEVDGLDAESLRSDIELAMSNGHNVIRIDFSEAEMVGAAGWGVLMKMAERGRLDPDDVKTLRIEGADPSMRRRIDEIQISKAGIEVSDPRNLEY